MGWDDVEQGWHLIIDNDPSNNPEYPDGWNGFNFVGWLDGSYLNLPDLNGNYHWTGREFYAEWEIKFNAQRTDFWHDGLLVYGNHFDDFIKDQPTEWTKFTAEGNVGPVAHSGLVCFLFDGDSADVHIRNVKVYFK